MSIKRIGEIKVSVQKINKVFPCFIRHMLFPKSLVFCLNPSVRSVTVKKAFLLIGDMLKDVVYGEGAQMLLHAKG